MSSSVQSFIHSLVMAPTLEDERSLIADELAGMRTYAKDCPAHRVPRVVAKLLYLDGLGCDTAWSQMAVVGLMAHERASHKRIGYIAAGHMFDAANERTVLLTATVQRDLRSPLLFVQRLALALVANACSAAMATSSGSRRRPTCACESAPRSPPRC
jgi:AP-3 complex subunit delta-1